MQNSVAPVAAVCFAASTSAGMSSQTARTGRGEEAGLGAEVAILRAAAGLERHDPLDLNLGAAPAHPHLVRGLQGGRDLVVRQVQDGQHAGRVQPGAGLDDSGHCLSQIGVGEGKHARTLQATSLILAERRREPGHTVPATRRPRSAVPQHSDSGERTVVVHGRTASPNEIRLAWMMSSAWYQSPHRRKQADAGRAGATTRTPHSPHGPVSARLTPRVRSATPITPSVARTVG